MQENILERSKLSNWRDQLSLVEKILLAVGFAMLTGLSAQIKIYLPWTPVPMSLQTFAVILSGIVMGVWGGLSQAIYVALGLVGIPWFASNTAGIQILVGPTGGYLIGFIIASMVTGYFTSKSKNNLLLLTAIIMAANLIIYVFGLLQLAFWSNIVSGNQISFLNLLSIGFIPFVAGDLIKSALAIKTAQLLQKI
ncbi:MAG: biotin transporter BioY [Caldisericaceae bacterium]